MFITFGGLGAHCTFGNFVSFILCRPTVYDKMERQNYLTSCRRKKRMSNHLSLMRRSDIIFLPQQFCCIFFNSNFYRSEKLIGIIFLKLLLPAAKIFLTLLLVPGVVTFKMFNTPSRMHLKCAFQSSIRGYLQPPPSRSIVF